MSSDRPLDHREGTRCIALHGVVERHRSSVSPSGRAGAAATAGRLARDDHVAALGSRRNGAQRRCAAIAADPARRDAAASGDRAHRRGRRGRGERFGHRRRVRAASRSRDAARRTVAVEPVAAVPTDRFHDGRDRSTRGIAARELGRRGTPRPTYGASAAVARHGALQQR